MDTLHGLHAGNPDELLWAVSVNFLCLVRTNSFQARKLVQLSRSPSTAADSAECCHAFSGLCPLAAKVEVYTTSCSQAAGMAVPAGCIHVVHGKHPLPSFCRC